MSTPRSTACSTGSTAQPRDPALRVLYGELLVERAARSAPGRRHRDRPPGAGAPRGAAPRTTRGSEKPWSPPDRCTRSENREPDGPPGVYLTMRSRLPVHDPPVAPIGCPTRYRRRRPIRTDARTVDLTRRARRPDPRLRGVLPRRLRRHRPRPHRHARRPRSRAGGDRRGDGPRVRRAGRRSAPTTTPAAGCTASASTGPARHAAA